MKEEQKKLKIKLASFFWVNILLLIGIALILLFYKGIDGKSVSEQDFVWERFGIIVSIAAIPFSLKFFHDRYKKIVNEELTVFLKKLEPIFFYRIFILDIAILLNFLGFFLIGALNFMYMAVIAIFVLWVCYPTESMIDPIHMENIKTNDNND